MVKKSRGGGGFVWRSVFQGFDEALPVLPSVGEPGGTRDSCCYGEFTLIVVRFLSTKDLKKKKTIFRKLIVI